MGSMLGKVSFKNVLWENYMLLELVKSINFALFCCLYKLFQFIY